MTEMLASRFEAERLSPADVSRPRICEVFDYWNELRGDRHLPCRDDFGPFKVRASLGLISIAEVLPGGRDFRYVLYGTELARVQGRDFTGALVSDLPPPEFAQLMLAHLREAVAEERPTAYRIRKLSATISLDYWRLLLPICDETGRVCEVMSVADLNREFWTAVSAA